MVRGEIYLVRRGANQDPKRQRCFVVVSRQVLLDSSFSSVICAPIYSRHDGLATQVAIGTDERLKHFSSIHCDELMSVPRSKLTHYIGRLSREKLDALNRALMVALGLRGSDGLTMSVN